MKNGFSNTPWLSAIGLALLLSPSAGRAGAPGAADLDRAIRGGDFGAYHTNLTAWLNQQAPAAVTTNALQVLLRNPVLVRALDQQRFIGLCGVNKLGAFAKADPGHQTFLAWLLPDAGVLDLYLEAGGVPAGEACLPTLAFWNKVFHADPDSRQGLCLKIAIATALTHPVTFSDERSLGKTDPYEGRYLYYKQAHRAGELLPSFERLSLWELQQVVEGMGAPPADLTWVRQMVRTWRPDLVRNHSLVKIVSEVRYGLSPLPIVDMASVLDAGGICGRRAHFGRKTCAAFGIPSIGILQPKHAALACKESGAWRVEYGAGWWQSTVDGGPDGPAFVAEAAARARAAEFSQAEHWKWFAAALTATNTAQAIVALAERHVPRAGDAPALAADPATKAEMKANAASQKTAAAPPAAGAAAPVTVGAGPVRVPADRFARMANVQVYDSLPDGTGRQVNFQKNMKESWVDYALDVPQAGTYALVLQLAAPNRSQVFTVTAGAGAPAPLALPNTRGLWGQSPPLEIALAQGQQTLRLAAPFQRGVAVKWLELQRRGN